MAVAGYDGMRVIYKALEATKGQGGGDALLAAMKGQVFESPRGPVLIDAQTRDIVQDIYIRKVERVPRWATSSTTSSSTCRRRSRTRRRRSSAARCGSPSCTRRGFGRRAWPPGDQAGFGRSGCSAAHDRRPRQNACSTRVDVREVVEADQLAGLVERHQVVDPRKGRDVGDRVVVAHQPGAADEALLEHVEQALRLGDVAVARPLVLLGLAGEFVEEADLAEHRPDPAHLEHQPLDRLVAAAGSRRQELPGLVGEVDQDRARFEQPERLAAGPVRIEDRRDLVVRAQRQELGRVCSFASKRIACGSYGRPVSSSITETLTPFGVGSE
jgi:hypothetical protein